MNAVIRATFADYRRVKGRKQGQLIFEVPLELLHDTVERLGGEPSVEGATWVAIALLNETSTKEAEHTKFQDMPAVKQAGILCNDKRFWAYLREEQKAGDIQSEEDAASFVRAFCHVDSRAELKPRSKEAHRWGILATHYRAWEEAERVGA